MRRSRDRDKTSHLIAPPWNLRPAGAPARSNQHPFERGGGADVSAGVAVSDAAATVRISGAADVAVSNATATVRISDAADLAVSDTTATI